jgi:hypothetical protein
MYNNEQFLKSIWDKEGFTGPFLLLRFLLLPKSMLTLHFLLFFSRFVDRHCHRRSRIRHQPRALGRDEEVFRLHQASFWIVSVLSSSFYPPRYWERNVLTGRPLCRFFPFPCCVCSVGPSSCECKFTDEIINQDPETWYGVITTTQTPGVPSGKSCVLCLDRSLFLLRSLNARWLTWPSVLRTCRCAILGSRS